MRAWIAAALLVAAAAAPAGAAGAIPTTATLVARGDSALAHLDLASATADFERAHRLDPTSYAADWKLARALVDRATLSQDRAEQKDLCERADSLARSAVALEPGDAKGHTFLAIALGKLALFLGGKRKVQLARAVEGEADSALALDPRDDLAHHVLGVWNREVVELPGALRFFARALYGRLPPASLAASADHLARAVDLRPDVIPHHVELGLTLAAERREGDARKELETALALPGTWVTDDYYRSEARHALADLRRRSR